MTYIYLSSSYWKKLTFSKSWFSKFKFLISGAISIHHKWIENRLLSPKGKCTSCLRSFQTPEDLGSWKLRKFQENPWKAWNWWQVISRPSKSQTSIVVLRNSEKSAVLNLLNCLRKYMSISNSAQTQQVLNLKFNISKV